MVELFVFNIDYIELMVHVRRMYSWVTLVAGNFLLRDFFFLLWVGIGIEGL